MILLSLLLIPLIGIFFISVFFKNNIFNISNNLAVPNNDVNNPSNSLKYVKTIALITSIINLFTFIYNI